jgi:hypothetical protein
MPAIVMGIEAFLGTDMAIFRMQSARLVAGKFAFATLVANAVILALEAIVDFLTAGVMAFPTRIRGRAACSA